MAEQKLRWKDFVFFLDADASQDTPFVQGKKTELIILGTPQGREKDPLGTYLYPRPQPLTILTKSVHVESRGWTVTCTICAPVPPGFKPEGTETTLRFNASGVGGARAGEHDGIASVVLDEEIPKPLLDELLLDWKLFDEPPTQERIRPLL